jgi:hypothetical protein
MARRKPSDSPQLFSPNGETTTDWPLIERALESPEVRTMYLYGPPGLGKTYIAYHHHGGRADAGVYAITMTEDTPAAELRGHYVPVKGDLVWRDGPFTEAMRKGARLVVNEVSHAAAEAMSFLHPVLESLDTARITLPTNETVRPAPGFHVICTDNAPPEDLQFSLQDRFTCRFEIRDPHPEALEKLSEPFRSAAVQTVGLEEDRRVSLRGWFDVQKLTPVMGLESACRAVFGPERGARILDALKLLETRRKKRGR